MIFSWFSATPPSNDIVTTTKEEDGWVQILTEEHPKINTEEHQVVPAKEPAPVQLEATVPSASTPPTEKKLSRQERRYQARIAQQQAKKAAVAGEDQLKAALKRARQKKQRIDKWNTACLPSSFALD